MLYLRGLSTGDFRGALGALLGEDAAGLSATNLARESLPLPVLVDPLVVHAWGLDLDRAGAHRHLPRLALAVAHHERSTVLVSRASVPLDVGGDLLLEGLLQHAPRSLTRQRVQRQRALFVLRLRGVLDYSQHRWRLLHPAPTGRSWLLSRWRIRRLLQLATDPRLLGIPRPYEWPASRDERPLTGVAGDDCMVS